MINIIHSFIHSIKCLWLQEAVVWEIERHRSICEGPEGREGRREREAGRGEGENKNKGFTLTSKWGGVEVDTG